MGVVDLSTLTKPTEEIETHLLIGGPKHGQHAEVTKGQNELTFTILSNKDRTLVPVKYMRREIQATTGNGTFKQVLYVESSLPIEQASMALQQVLLQAFAEQLVIQFMEGGERLGSDNEQHD